MIRIEKTKRTPVALATPAVAAALLALETRYDANPVACRALGSRLLNVQATLYNDEQVKAKLIAQQRGKCCYCEAKFLHIGYGDVEHYRPKNGFRQDAASPLEKPGYYWLAYTWDNLLFSCKRCNVGYKRNYFPLANPAGRARSHHDQPQLQQEQPLLLHPAHDNPAAHIRFRRAVAVSKTPRGQATITLCGLNRKHNLERRRTHLAHLDSHDSLASLDPMTMSKADLARQIARCGSIAVFIKRVGQAKTICDTAALDAAEFAGMVRANFPHLPTV